MTTALTYLQTALALAAVFASTSWLPRGIFVIYWHGFFIGVLAYGAGYLRRPPYLLFLLSVVMLVKAPSSPQVFNTPCVGTAMFLFLAARGSYLVDGLRSQAWQRLGDLSYSLYLVHGPVIVLGFGVWTRLCGHGALQDAAGFVIVTSGTLVVAGIFWLVIEQPSHRLSRRIRLFRQP